MNPRLRKTPGRTYYESSIEDFVSCKHPQDIIEFLTESDESSDDSELHFQKKRLVKSNSNIAEIS